MQAMPVTSRAAGKADLGTLAKLRSVKPLTIVALACCGTTCVIQQISESHKYRPSAANIQHAM